MLEGCRKQRTNGEPERFNLVTIKVMEDNHLKECKSLRNKKEAVYGK